MTWQNNRPILDKLPKHSGNWHENELVNWLTGFWDDQLADLRSFIDRPDSFLSPNCDERYLDYVGSGLCGYGRAWNQNYPEEIKRKLIQSFIPILSARGSEQSIRLLIDIVIPGSTLIHYRTPLADIAEADLSVVSDYPTTRYMICLPNSIQREGKEWRWMRQLINSFMPIGSVSLQYQINYPNKTLAGDWSV